MKKTCRVCNKEEGTGKRRMFQIPEDLEKWEQRAKTSKEDWKWQTGITAHRLSESNWRKATCRSKGGNRKSTNVQACQLEVSGTMPPPMALCCEILAGGARADGQCCSLITTRGWSCASSGKLSVLLWLMLTIKESLMGCGEVKRGTLAQVQRTPTCGS